MLEGELPKLMGGGFELIRISTYISMRKELLTSTQEGVEAEQHVEPLFEGGDLD